MIAKTMTSPRHQRKLRPARFGLRTAVLAMALAVVGAGAGGALRASTGERVVVDYHTGLAISGFDPVAYFTEGIATPGKGEFEYRLNGAVWRFRNEGNRAAFAADPQVYMPRFGGYDPMGIVRGVAVPGNPRLWFVTSGRLYLFHTMESQAAFALDIDRSTSSAERKWPTVMLTLTP